MKGKSRILRQSTGHQGHLPAREQWSWDPREEHGQAKGQGPILQALNNSVCEGPETGESWACLSCCRKARVAVQSKEDTGRSHNVGEVDSARWGLTQGTSNLVQTTHVFCLLLFFELDLRYHYGLIIALELWPKFSFGLCMPFFIFKYVNNIK